MLLDELNDLIKKSNIKETLVEKIYNEIVDKLKLAAILGNSTLLYNFKFLSEDRDYTTSAVINLLRSNGIFIKQINPNDKYLVDLSWEVR